MTISLCTIQDKSIDFAARIFTTATPADMEAIAAYGAALLIGARIGSRTTFAFVQAIESVTTPEYTTFTETLLENEVELLENEIAKLVARLAAPGKRL